MPERRRSIDVTVIFPPYKVHQRAANRGYGGTRKDEANAPELRGRTYSELAAYCYPKRRAGER